MANVKPVPEGMSTVTPHIVCKDAAQAIEFYKQAFGAVEIDRLMAPDGSKLLHATMRIGDSVVMLADEFPEWGSVGPLTLEGSPVTLHIYVDDADAAAERAVRAGAKITMALENTFWGDRYGTLEDPFGHRWAVATHVRDVPADEMLQAVREMYAKSAAPEEAGRKIPEPA